jgi:hypothetical protein
MDSSIFPQDLLCRSARQKLKRWSTANAHPSPEARGKIMSQYLVYKLNRKNVFTKDLNRQLSEKYFIKLNKVLERCDLREIKKELMGHTNRDATGDLTASHNQVTNFRIDHHKILNMKSAGTPFLGSWLGGVVENVFPGKIFYDIYCFHTKTRRTEWKGCQFHTDLVDGPDEWDFTNVLDKSPISIYFPVDDGAIALDMEYRVSHLGPQRKVKTIKIVLNPGDLLIFATTKFLHRTSEPDPLKDVPDRINIILTGIEDVIDLTYYTDNDNE